MPMPLSSRCNSDRFLVPPEPSRGAAYPRRPRRYPSRVIRLIGYTLVGSACLTGCLAWAEGRPGADRPERLSGDAPVAEAVAQVGSNTAWIGIAGIVTILVNGAVTAAIAISKNKQDTAAKIADSEARMAAKVAEAKEEVRVDMARKEELDRKHRHEARDQDGLVMNELRDQVTANSDAIAAIPRRSSDPIPRRSSDVAPRRSSDA